MSIGYCCTDTSCRYCFGTGFLQDEQVNFRRLKKGEVIQAGDEIDRCADAWRDDPVWGKVHLSDVGRAAPDPQYPSHRQYRRLG